MKGQWELAEKITGNEPENITIIYFYRDLIKFSNFRSYNKSSPSTPTRKKPRIDQGKGDAENNKTDELLKPEIKSNYFIYHFVAKLITVLIHVIFFFSRRKRR